MQPMSDLVRERVERIIVENEMLRAGFAAFPYLVMKDKTLSIGARMTYAFLLMYAWQDERCFAGQKKMAEDMGVSTRQLRRYLTDLREAGYVKIERKDKRFNNTYVLLDRKQPTKLKAKQASHRS